MQDAAKSIQSFLEDNGRMYPISVVSRALNVTNKSLTNWRQRDMLPFPPTKYNDRFSFSRDGVITAGLISEVSWLLGPKDASDFSRSVFEEFSEAGLFQSDEATFREENVVFHRPLFVSGLSRKPRFPKASEDVWDQVSGFVLRRSKSTDEARPNHSTVIVPVGHLICQWALAIDGEMGA